MATFGLHMEYMYISLLISSYSSNTLIYKKNGMYNFKYAPTLR
jgi:hypothetical protein